MIVIAQGKMQDKAKNTEVIKCKEILLIYLRTRCLPKTTDLKFLFLVGGLVSYESNDTAEKQAQSTKYLEEILAYITSLNENDSEKSEFIHHIKGTIERYLNWEE